MNELIERLRAALAAEALAAQSAIRQSHTSRRMIDGQMVDVPIRPSRWRDAAWPPERVLAMVTAHRELIATYEQACVYYDAHKDAPAGEVHGLYAAIELIAKGYGIDE